MSASLGAQMVKHLHAMQKAQVRSLGQEDPWRRQWQPIPVCLPGKSYGQRSVTYSTDCRVTVTGKARGTWVLKCLKSGECCNYQENSRFCPTITDSSMSPHFSHSKGVLVYDIYCSLTPLNFQSFKKSPVLSSWPYLLCLPLFFLHESRCSLSVLSIQPQSQRILINWWPASFTC